MPSYPHMCRMDHVEIGHAVSDDDERCPLCRMHDDLAFERAANVNAGEEIQRLRQLVIALGGDPNA